MLDPEGLPRCSPVPSAGADKGVPRQARSEAAHGEAVCTLASCLLLIALSFTATAPQPSHNQGGREPHLKNGTKRPSTAPTPQTSHLGRAFEMGKLRQGKWMLKVGWCSRQGGSDAGERGWLERPPMNPPHIEGV